MLSAFEAAGAAAGRPSDEIHVEYFTQKYESATTGGYVVELARSKKEFQIPDGKSILHVLLDAGIDVSHSCEEGICGACETKVLDGTPDHRDAILTEAERAGNKTMMVCCSGAKSPKLVLDL
jgi:ferredoxin